MRALLDTNAAIYSWIEPEKLSEAARRVIEAQENQLFFSQVSILEITLKNKLGKLPLPDKPEHYLPARIEAFSLNFLPLENEDIYNIGELPEIHKDPFDWLLLCIAKRLKLPIISSDQKFSQYPVKVVW
ncbi:MAG: type II toxin-antitoxin system VapC family toxin [Verrucomicrobiota bacterium]